MAIVPLSSDHVEVLTLVTNPKRTFSSSSVSGPTGSIPIFVRASPTEKPARPLLNFKISAFEEDPEKARQRGWANYHSTQPHEYPSGVPNPLYQPTPFAEAYDNNIDQNLKQISDIVNGNLESGIAVNVESELSDLMDRVNKLTRDPRRHKSVEVTRFQPSFRFTKNTGRKNTVKNVLLPYYRQWYWGMQWAFSNYHCLNFFTSSGTPSDTALIYKAGYGNESPKNGEIRYCPSQSFTFDFYINPRYTIDTPTSEFHAGTILHMSSCYAISLVTGSSRGLNNYSDGYRIMLQLSHSAEILPSEITLTASNNSYLRADQYDSLGGGDHGDLIFLSSDNSLRRNHWHHVAIRWGGPKVNDGIGAFYIDGKPNATFVIPSSSIMDPLEKPLIRSGSDALFLGNFWEGYNTPTITPSLQDQRSFICRFFNSASNAEHGVTRWEQHDIANSGSFVGDESNNHPDDFAFNHPLNAEIHDVKIYSSHRSTSQIVTGSQKGPTFLEDDLLFYVPPYFVRESRPRMILQTPFISTSDASTNDPFNIPLSFGVGSHYLNLENYTREFVEREYPLLYNLTASRIDAQTKVATADYWLHNPPGGDLVGARKRNLTVLPCDNGKFRPGFRILASGSVMGIKHDAAAVLADLGGGFQHVQTITSGSETEKFVNDFGILDFSLVTLNNLVHPPQDGSMTESWIMPQLTSSYVTKVDNNPDSPTYGADLGSDSTNPDAVWVGEIDEHGDPKVFQGGSPESLLADLDMGAPEDPSLGSGVGGRLSILERTKDTSSNEVAFFDVSNMFYGERILPGSFYVMDESLTGSDGKVKMTLKDNGHGVLYRADAETPHATWSNIGNIFYDDGLAVVKTPNIPNFGKHQFETSFTGQHRTYVYQVSVLCPKGMINSSSNPSFKKIKPSNYLSEHNDDFVYITGINLHDENLNIVARANLAQPVAKRNTDHYLFKIKIDY